MAHTKEKTKLTPFDKPIMLPISQIRRDGGTQPRASLHHETIIEYAEDMKNGNNFPPVTVFYNGSDYWLADGFHRVEAGIAAGLTEIAAIVKQGLRRDAVLYSVGANAKHGLRRSNADKRRAVMTLLEDEEWSHWSDNQIAQKTSTSQPFVSKLRKLTNLDGERWSCLRKPTLNFPK
jgi:ParB-like chromosome segregation protein Spo0J